jgi:hypothetical protein
VTVDGTVDVGATDGGGVMLGAAAGAFTTSVRTETVVVAVSDAKNALTVIGPAVPEKFERIPVVLMLARSSALMLHAGSTVGAQPTGVIVGVIVEVPLLVTTPDVGFIPVTVMTLGEAARVSPVQEPPTTEPVKPRPPSVCPNPLPASKPGAVSTTRWQFGLHGSAQACGLPGPINDSVSVARLVTMRSPIQSPQTWEPPRFSQRELPSEQVT